MRGGVADRCGAWHRQPRCRVGRNERDRCLGLGAGHQLRVNRRPLDREVAHRCGLGQGNDANIGAGVGHHRVAHLGTVARARERAGGWRPGEVMAQRVTDLDRDHMGLVVLVVVVSEGALDHRHRGGAHVLFFLCAEVFVFDQDQGLANVGDGVADALKQLDDALPSDVILEQIARPFGALVEVCLDAHLGLLAGVERPLGGEQGDTDAGVLRRLGHDHIGPEISVRVIGVDRHEGLAQVDPAARTVQLRDVRKDGVRDPIGNRDAGGRATAFGHVRHDSGLQQFDVAGLNRHQKISKKRRVRR